MQTDLLIQQATMVNLYSDLEKILLTQSTKNASLPFWYERQVEVNADELSTDE